MRRRPRRAPASRVYQRVRAGPTPESSKQSHAQQTSAAPRIPNGAWSTPPRQCARDHASVLSTGHPSSCTPAWLRARTQQPYSSALARLRPHHWLLGAPRRVTSRYERRAPHRQVHLPKHPGGNGCWRFILQPYKRIVPPLFTTEAAAGGGCGEPQIKSTTIEPLRMR